MKNIQCAVLFFTLTIFSLLHGQRNEVGSVFFSWNRAGDVILVIRYKGEELKPLGGLHFHEGGYYGSLAQAQLAKVTRMGQLFAASCYRYNRVKFNWWEYAKSFFCKPKQLGSQKLTLFDNGQYRYEGRRGGLEVLFRQEAGELLNEFEMLQRLRANVLDRTRQIGGSGGAPWNGLS